MTEDELVGWHHQHNGHESKQTQRVGDGQGSLTCGRPWGRKESDTTERLHNNKWGRLDCSFKISLQDGSRGEVGMWLKRRDAHMSQNLKHGSVFSSRINLD